MASGSIEFRIPAWRVYVARAALAFVAAPLARIGAVDGCMRVVRWATGIALGDIRPTVRRDR